MTTLGWVMLAVPIVGLFVLIARIDGLAVALAVFGITVVVMSWIVLAAVLLAGGFK